MRSPILRRDDDLLLRVEFKEELTQAYQAPGCKENQGIGMFGAMSGRAPRRPPPPPPTVWHPVAYRVLHDKKWVRHEIRLPGDSCYVFAVRLADEAYPKGLPNAREPSDRRLSLLWDTE